MNSIIPLLQCRLADTTNTYLIVVVNIFFITRLRRAAFQRQHQQYLNIHHQQQTEQEMTEEEERYREYRELRIISRINRGIDNVDGQSTLSDGLLWMIDAAEDITSELQCYEQYKSDGGKEARDIYRSDFNNLRPSPSNMQHPPYKEWYRNNIYNRWCSDRCRGTGFTTLIDLDDLVSMWLSYRQQPPSSTNTSIAPSDEDSSFDSDTKPWHPVPPYLTITLTPPPSPSIHSNNSSNRYSLLALDENDEVDMDTTALTTSL